MTALKQEVIQLVEQMPEEQIPFIIQFVDISFMIQVSVD